MASTSPIINIRQFRDEDLPEVAEIFEYGMMLYASDSVESKAQWVEYIRKSLKADLADVEGTYMAPGGNFWVATVEDSNGESKVAGMIGLEPKDNGEAEVRRVSVHADYQRMGIGRKLMTHLKVSAVTFYTSFGFQIGKTCKFMENPPQKVVFLHKTLP
ncbi:Acetyltransferase (GNAT) family [Phytophthora palmivora]|uniref:Acetyltransferase (GNAT) family n=1 Tax=Phytophthora palmivora TaxID=4796 RepID=A0A2P4X4I8_9STRA|nr:Acetyltransferase (GNAT) family [Phytophthora palmivora]